MAEPSAYPPVTTRIEADDVRRFSEAVKADPDAGVPPTFAAVYAIRHGIHQMLADASLAIDPARLLHGEQDIVWDRHPRVGDTVTARSRVISDVQKGSLRFLTVESVAIDQDGDRVCVARAVMAVRS
ncbi:MaoC family dehydratase N-terminal domain-containing protein [Streptosporangium sp. NPDC051022]|uniref:FAS1-like dehydratase domain-containing protein n=1 Tax=Streptosporangium sp. NPDC051022 TaxID=3155752 RepID=UPI00343D1308